MRARYLYYYLGFPQWVWFHRVSNFRSKDEALTLSRQAFFGVRVWGADSNGQLCQCACSA